MNKSTLEVLRDVRRTSGKLFTWFQNNSIKNNQISVIVYSAIQIARKWFSAIKESKTVVIINCQVEKLTLY